MTESGQRPADLPFLAEPQRLPELLRRYLPGLRGFLRLRAGRLLLEKESCSDLAQSVCRDVLENAGKLQFDSEAGFRKWLYTTALRKIADRYEYYLAEKRNANREQAADDESDEQRTLGAYAGFYSPSQHAVAREEITRVERAFGQLGEEQQNVILMAKMMGLPHVEIAKELGKTETAVRTALSRAIARLTELLGDAPGHG